MPFSHAFYLCRKNFTHKYFLKTNNLNFQITPAFIYHIMVETVILLWVFYCSTWFKTNLKSQGTNTSLSILLSKFESQVLNVFQLPSWEGKKITKPSHQLYSSHQFTTFSERSHITIHTIRTTSQRSCKNPTNNCRLISRATAFLKIVWCVKSVCRLILIRSLPNFLVSYC